jgi:hypothetical protein
MPGSVARRICAAFSLSAVLDESGILAGRMRALLTGFRSGSPPACDEYLLR